MERCFQETKARAREVMRAKDLRDQNDVFSTESIRQMAGWQGKRDHGHGDDQPDQPKRSRRMGAGINLPFHCHGEHQTAGDGE